MHSSRAKVKKKGGKSEPAREPNSGWAWALFLEARFHPGFLARPDVIRGFRAARFDSSTNYTHQFNISKAINKCSIDLARSIFKSHSQNNLKN
jgi:hypothetical protein